MAREDSTDETDEAVIDPVEQRLVALAQAGDDEVLAARTDDATIYVPVRPLCTALGLGWSPQLRKIRADEVLAEGTRQLRLQTRGGPQVMLCMDLEAIPLWLAGINPSRVREDLRERLKVYKRWVRKVVYEAFEISALVKAIATEMAAHGGAGRNPYQAVFGELYRRFRVSSYHNIPLRRFGEVMA